jgi:FAD/FMN-containing dehydrogenase
VHVFGAMLGTRADATLLLDALVALADAKPASVTLRELPYRHAKRRLAEHGPGDDASPAAHSYAKSEFFRRALPRETVAALLEHLAGDRAPRQLRGLDFTPWGGAYNRVRADATAFAHRAERFLLKHDIAIDPDADAAQRRSASDWLARSWALVRPWGSGRVYPNFPDPDLVDWPTAVHATNLERLTRIKAAYDPDDVFRFHQSLPVRR